MTSNTFVTATRFVYRGLEVGLYGTAMGTEIGIERPARSRSNIYDIVGEDAKGVRISNEIFCISVQSARSSLSVLWNG